MTTRKAKPTSKRAAKKKAKPPARTKGQRATSKKTGKSLRVRMYRVGFGDFFLVIVPTSAHGDQYILIDCGVFKGTSGTGDIGSIVECVEDMHKTTGGKLALVIMTHRHADHIAGFSKAEIFKEFTAGMVWMPYWEQFNDKGKEPAHKLQLDAMVANLTSVALQLQKQPDVDSKEVLEKLGQVSAIQTEDENSAHNLLVDIDDLAAQMAIQFRGREDDEGREALAQLGNATGIEDFNAAATDKKKRGGNAGALDLLKNHLGKDGKNVRYYAAGDKPDLPPELKELKATILGPPPEKAKAFLALMDLKKGVGQYLDSTTGNDGSTSIIRPFPDEWFAVDLQTEYRQTEAKWPIDFEVVKTDVGKSQPDMLVAAASKIENFLNNQSLVVLFEFGGRRLLFAGDAQGGNWEYWLYKTDVPTKDPTEAGEIIEKSKELLETIDFYKVGHHGSTNATPIQAVEAAIARPKGSHGFVSMCSTEDDVYGNKKKETEVPRTRLMDVLEKESCLIRSDAIEISITDPETKKTTKVAARKGVNLPEPKVGKISKSALYLEYSF